MSLKLCNFYGNGNCRNGSQCRFIHSDDNKCKCNSCVKKGQNYSHKKSLCHLWPLCKHGDKCSYVHPNDFEIKNCVEIKKIDSLRTRYRPVKRDHSTERNHRNYRSTECDRSSEQNSPKRRICIEASPRNVYNPRVPRDPRDAYDHGVPRDPRNVYNPEASRDPRNVYNPEASRDLRNTYNPYVYQPIIYNTIPRNPNMTRRVSKPYDPESPAYPPPPSPVSTKYSHILGCNCYYSNTRLRWYYQVGFGNSIWCTTDVNNELNSS